MKKLFPFALLAFTLFLYACNSSSGDGNGKVKIEVEDNEGTKQSYEVENPENLEEAMTKVKDALQGINTDEAVEVVNFRDLQNLLGENLAGMTRVAKEGQTTGAMGFKISVAEAEYEDPNSDKTVKIELVDGGGIGIATMAAAAWASTEIDKEDRNGFERTTKINGHHAFEEFDKRDGDGKVALLVAERFILNISGRNLDNIDYLRAIVDEIDLSNLEKLAPK